jgi:hypothetical protein
MGYQRYIVAGPYVDVATYSKDYVYRPPRHTKKRKRVSKKEANRRVTTVYRSGRSIWRARQSFFLLVASNLQKDIYPTFLTFTLEQDLTIEEGYVALRFFFKTLNKRFGRDVRYICVPEWQKSGKLHFHALAWGVDSRTVFDEIPRYYTAKFRGNRRRRFIQFCELYGYDPASARGTRYLQGCWGRGFIDVLGTTKNTLGIAGYMAKYLVKGLSDPRLANTRAYSTSHNIFRPLKTGFNSSHHGSEIMGEYIDTLVNIEKQATYDTLYLGKCYRTTFNNLE